MFDEGLRTARPLSSKHSQIVGDNITGTIAVAIAICHQLIAPTDTASGKMDDISHSSQPRTESTLEEVLEVSSYIPAPNCNLVRRAFIRGAGPSEAAPQE